MGLLWFAYSLGMYFILRYVIFPSFWFFLILLFCLFVLFYVFVLFMFCIFPLIPVFFPFSLCIANSCFGLNITRSAKYDGGNRLITPKHFIFSKFSLPNVIKKNFNIQEQDRREEGCDGCAPPPPPTQPAEVHFFVDQRFKKSEFIKKLDI